MLRRRFRRFNRALGKMTGFQLTRVPPVNGAEPVKLYLPESGDEVRPPAEPRFDRLLRAPVFIISSIRAGSTLLRAMLDTHPQLHAPHEMHVRRLRVTWEKDLVKRAMREVGHNLADLEHLLWDRVLHRELERSGKDVIVDKTPSNAFAYQRIATCWPDARYIFLLRHPASIAQSWYESSSTERTTHEAALDALRYMKAANRARRALPGLTVRYEDLTRDPDGETRRICDFLGLQWHGSMARYGEQPVIRKGLGDWRDKIRSGVVQEGRPVPDADQIPPELVPMCKAWGYPVGTGRSSR